MKNKMATPLGTVFFTDENQVSQCDEQTFGSIAETPVIHSGQEKFKQLLSGGSKSLLRTREYKEVDEVGTPLANSSKQVSTETDKALRKPNMVFWHNKETVSQCECQNLKPVTFENLVVHFDQGKFKELLSEGSPVLHIRKHRKVSMANVLEQKPLLPTPLSRARGLPGSLRT